MRRGRRLLDVDVARQCLIHAKITDVRGRLSAKAVWNLAKMGLRGHANKVRRVYSAVRDMRNAKAYLPYPGSVSKPDFVPAEFGSVGWVDGHRSYLTERAGSVAQ